MLVRSAYFRCRKRALKAIWQAIQHEALAVALREVGRIEGSLFAIDWLQNMELRRRGSIQTDHCGADCG